MNQKRNSDRFIWLTVLITILPVLAEIGNGAAPYIRAAHLNPSNRDLLRAIGDRLQRQGNERVVLKGVLTSFSSGQATASNIQCTIEFADKIRVDNLAKASVLIHDGTTGWKSTGSLGKDDYDLIDSMLSDSVDDFFLSQIAASGAPVRAFTQPFRLVGSKASASRPTNYRVLQLLQQNKIRGKVVRQSKLYCFRTDNNLLERVLYTDVSATPPIRVETLFSNWSAVQNQMLPGEVTRSENGVVTLDFKINLATVGPKMQDGLFTQH